MRNQNGKTMQKKSSRKRNCRCNYGAGGGFVRQLTKPELRAQRRFILNNWNL